MKATTVVALCLLILAPAADATTIHVPGDQPTIQLGAWYATPGDTVLVACGTYYENLIYIDESITLLSETGDPGCVTIDGGGTDRILIVWAATDVVVAGFTFTHAYADVGAAAAIDSSDVTIVDCVFTENVATIEGAGLRYRKGTMDIRGCDFTHNDATFSGGGAAIQTAGGQIEDCYFMGNQGQWGAGLALYWNATTTVNGCTFEENDAVGGETYGGGIYTWEGTTVSVTSCGFYGNTSEYCGGGACSDTDCDDTYAWCTFDGNSARFGGGLYAWDDSPNLIDGCSFTGNTAESGGGVLLEEVSNATILASYFAENTATLSGGGLTLDSCSTVTDDCTFAKNDAVYGAAIAITDAGAPVVTSCTLVLNGSTAGRTMAAGLALRDNSEAQVTQTIIAFSQEGAAVQVEPGSAILLTTCDIYGNAGGDWTGSIASQLPLRHNMDGDPNFCGIHSEDYSLCADSPCLPANNGAGLPIGRYGNGCDPCGSPVEPTSWGAIKALYR